MAEERQIKVLIKPSDVTVDPVPLMRQLARMAGVPDGKFRRMVLVLDVADVPRLYTESFIAKDEPEELIDTPLAVEEKPVIVNTTTMQDDPRFEHHSIRRV